MFSARLLCVSLVVAVSTAVAAAAEKPNIIFILADDLGYGDLGCYGQKQIQTPCLDRMAAEGLRFTDCYAGSTVCAPSRSVLMTGQHTGHTTIRGNAAVPLRPEDVTVAKVLKSAGYATGLIGKWGLGEADTTGAPNRQGFDYSFGYLNQTHAHNYYPEYLWRNGERVPLKNEVGGKWKNSIGGVAVKRVEYSHDLFAAEALKFVEQHKGAPFFLYLAFTMPHANNEAGKEGMEVPDYGPYADKDWPTPEKGRAAMITRMDADVGRLFTKLNELKLDEKTIVFFTSDNGPHREGGADPDFFRSSGPLTGIKRSLHDGGIRVPMIVRWPGKVPAGRDCPLVWAFWDFLPTVADLAGVEPPKNIDGISIERTLRVLPISAPISGTGPYVVGDQKGHDFLYWEFHEGGSKQAVRMGQWKAIRQKLGAPLELYDLSRDLGEERNIAADHPDIIAKIEAYLKTARTESEHWPLTEGGKRKQ